MNEHWRLSLSEGLRKMEEGALTATQWVRSLLSRIDACEEEVKAWVQVDAQGAIEAAKAVDDARSAGEVVSRLRGLNLVKQPGVAETINWARALNQLGETSVTPQNLELSLGSVIKDHDDLSTVKASASEILDGV